MRWKPGVGTLRVGAPLIGALLLAMLGSTDAHAAVVIYRCTDAFGRLTVQNDTPCPKGSARCAMRPHR